MAEIGSMHPGGLLFSENSAGRVGAVKPNVTDIYRAELTVHRDGKEYLRIDTPLPENYMLSLATSWDNPFNQPLSNIAGSMGGISGKAVDLSSTGVTAATGFTTLNKWLSGAVWTGGSMMKLDIPFVIQAYKDPREEVVEKMRDLMKLVAPSEYGDQFLRAPGPYMRLPNAGGVAGDLITVNIGKFFTMSPCIIDNVTETFDTQFDASGNPIGVTINVSVMSFFTTTQEDLDRFFAPSLGG